MVEERQEAFMDTNVRQLHRSATNRMIAGVCGGMGDYLNIDPTIIRLMAVLLFFMTGGGMIVAYLIMALIVPEEPARQSP
jgi:phage shock protein PspC (stress-responsive transcriptional regulator)